MTWRIKCLLTMSVALFYPHAAFSWGCDGHRIVAEVAYRNLNLHARKAVQQLLQTNPIDPNLKRFCVPAGLPPFVDVSTWADDIRQVRSNTAPWHFIDIPIQAPLSSIRQFCSPQTQCVVTAISANIATLRSTQTTTQDKAEALMFIIHFVGDMHQPLHTTTNNDRGANCLPVTFFGAAPQGDANENYRPNLHGIWDTELVQNLRGNSSYDEYAQHLSQRFNAKMGAWKTGRIALLNWVWEGHRLAVSASYGDLGNHVPVEDPQPVTLCSDDNHVSQRLAALNEQVEARYQQQVTPVIEEQLAKAGARLALVLNAIWPN